MICFGKENLKTKHGDRPISSARNPRCCRLSRPRSFIFKGVQGRSSGDNSTVVDCVAPKIATPNSIRQPCPCQNLRIRSDQDHSTSTQASINRTPQKTHVEASSAYSHSTAGRPFCLRPCSLI
jgi:hypothetical protein